MDTSKWQIIRCWYDPTGLGTNDIENPERMQEHIDKEHYGGFGHIIGVVHENDNGQKIVETILEGRDEILEFIIEKINP